MSLWRRDVVVVVACLCGVLIGRAYATDDPPESQPVATVSQQSVDRLAAALEAASRADLAPADRALVDEARDVLDGIRQGETQVSEPTEQGAPPGTVDNPLDGHAGEGDVGETSTSTTAAPGSAANPLDGNAEPSAPPPSTSPPTMP